MSDRVKRVRKTSALLLLTHRFPSRVTLPISPVCVEWCLTLRVQAVVLVCESILSEPGQEEKGPIQKEILFARRNFETFLYGGPQCIFVHCMKSDQEMCIFPKKKSGKVPGRPYNYSKIDIFMSLFMFSHFAFSFFVSCCIFFHQSYFG